MRDVLYCDECGARLNLYVVGVCSRCHFDLTGEDEDGRREPEAPARSVGRPRSQERRSMSDQEARSAAQTDCPACEEGYICRQGEGCLLVEVFGKEDAAEDAYDLHDKARLHGC